MPRIRSIKPKFWDDITLSKVSRDARLLFIGTWTHADDLGVIIADPVWLKSKIFPYDKLEVGQLEKWLLDLVLNKFIIPISYRDENFFVIRNFDKHQRINKPNNEDIFIDNEKVKKLLEQSRNNQGIITERSLTNIESITGGEDRIGEDRKGRESNVEVLKKSNLFREPNIPVYENVLRTFKQNGGTEEMAKNFFNKNEALGWFLNGSPITNYANLVPNYVSTWKSNEKKNGYGHEETKDTIPANLKKINS